MVAGGHVILASCATSNPLASPRGTPKSINRSLKELKYIFRTGPLRGGKKTGESRESWYLLQKAWHHFRGSKTSFQLPSYPMGEFKAMLTDFRRAYTARQHQRLGQSRSSKPHGAQHMSQPPLQTAQRGSLAEQSSLHQQRCGWAVSRITDLSICVTGTRTNPSYERRKKKYLRDSKQGVWCPVKAASNSHHVTAASLLFLCCRS